MQLMMRDYELLQWLVHLKFLGLDQITSAFFPGCNPMRAPYRRMLKLMKAGLVAKKRVYTEPKALYVATVAAVRLLRSKGYPYPLGLSRDKHFMNYLHDKVLIDLRILFKALGIGIWVPERVIRSIKPKGAVPDALIITKHANYALEYERTEKKLVRYGDIFRRYISREHYDAVLYICHSESFVQRLKRKFRPPSNISFITLDELFDLKEDAVFSSDSDALSVRDLTRDSRKGGLHSLNLEYLKKLIHPLPDESWKEKKPFIPNLKMRHVEEDEEDGYESGFKENPFNNIRCPDSDNNELSEG